GESRHVGGARAAGHLACLRVVLERRGKMIGRPGRALDDLALVVGVLDLVLGGDRLDLRIREPWTAGLGEVAERQELEAVAVLANLAGDLEAALRLRALVCAGRTRERP